LAANRQSQSNFNFDFDFDFDFDCEFSALGREPPQRGLAPGSRGIVIVISRYQATIIEDTAGWKRLVYVTTDILG
jgi:hypothetical protein